MRLFVTFFQLLAALSIATAFVADRARTDITPRQPDEHVGNEFWKRRGGGGGGGRGGGGGSSGSSGGRGGSSSGSGSSGSTGSSGGTRSGGSSGSGGGRGSSTSSVGGRTTTGSGPAPAYGGGKYYGGGAAVPYKAGDRSRSGINPVLLGAGAAVAFWPGLWLYGAYMYPYTHHHSFYNASSKQNETKPVTCGCDPYQVCGCDENGDQQYLSDIVGNGTNLNSTLVAVGTVDGVQRILINGTLPNGTTAAGGTEDPNGGAGLRTMLHTAGWWPVVAIVSAMVLTV
ncbi:hypothetical protein OQA88_3982 [Cercophora sp. LCS_1]